MSVVILPGPACWTSLGGRLARAERRCKRSSPRTPCLLRNARRENVCTCFRAALLCFQSSPWDRKASVAATQGRRAPGSPRPKLEWKRCVARAPLSRAQSHQGLLPSSRPGPGGEPLPGPFAGLWLALSGQVSSASPICPGALVRLEPCSSRFTLETRSPHVMWFEMGSGPRPRLPESVCILRTFKAERHCARRLRVLRGQ